MLALSSPRPQQLDFRNAPFLGGIAGLCLGLCLVIQGLWVGSMLHQAITAPWSAYSRDLATNPSADVVASGASDTAGWTSGIAATTQPVAPQRRQAASGARVLPLPEYPEITFQSRSFDTRDWLFIVSWQASRGAHGGMRASSVAPSTAQGKQRHKATETVTWRPRS